MEFLFTPALGKRFLFLILVTLAAWGLLQFFIPSSQSYWGVYTLFMLSFIQLGNTFLKRLIIIFLTGIIAGILAFSAVFLSGWAFLLAIYLAVIAVISTLFVQRYNEYFFSAFLIILFTLLSAFIPAGLVESFARFGFIITGTSIVVILQIIFLWQFNRNDFFSWVTAAINKLSELTAELFSCFLHLEYIDNLYLFERRLHVQKNKFMQSRIKLQEILQATNQNQQSFKQTLKKLDQLFAILLDLSQLRWRVSDFTIFAVCHDDLKAIATELKKLFRIIAANKVKNFDTSELNIKIQRFEETFNHVLRVTAREPLVFLLFISSLKILSAQLQEFAEDLSGLTNL